MSSPPSLPIIRWRGFFGSMYIAWLSTWPEVLWPPAASSVANVLPPSVDLAHGRPETYTVFGFCGSTRTCEKYIGRALQLLVMVQLRPLLSERKRPLAFVSSLGGSCGCAPPRPPRPAPEGAPLLHQSKPPRPPPAGGFSSPPAAAAAPAALPARPVSPASICTYTTFGLERDTPIARRPHVPPGRPLPVSFVHVRPASSVFQRALPGPPPLKQQPLRRRW